MAKITMSYIIIEQKVDDNRTTTQIIYDCLDESGYMREKNNYYIDNDNSIQYSIKHKDRSKRYYLELNSNMRVNKGVIFLANMDDALLKSKEQEYISILRVYDGTSAVYCEKLYPKLSIFERRLRQLILLVLTKAFGTAWRNKTISDELLNDMKSKAKSKGSLSLSDTLEQFDLAEMESYLFEKREVDYKEYLEKQLSHENIINMSKEEICDVLNEMRPCSLWERNFSWLGDQLDWQKQILNVHKFRNKVAHSKRITNEVYVSANKALNKLNKSLNDSIGKIQEKDFENINSIDLLGNLAIALSKFSDALRKQMDYQSLLNNINSAIKIMVEPLKKTYMKSINDQFEQNKMRMAEIGNEISKLSKNTTPLNTLALEFNAINIADNVEELAKNLSESYANIK